MINKNKLFYYFNKNFTLVKSTNNWYRFVNPFDSHKDISMAVNFEYNIVKDFRTDYSDYPLNFIARVEDITLSESIKLVNSLSELKLVFKKSNKDVNITKCKLPDHWKSLSIDSRESKRVCKYLENRGFNLNELINQNFGFCDKGEFKDYLIIPYSVNGNIVYYIGRSISKNQLRYKNPKTEDVGIGKSELFFNEDALYFYDEIFLVEGWADALTLGRNAIASSGWKLSQEQKSKIIRAKPTKLTIVPDRGFYKQALKTALILNDYVTTIHVVNFDHIDKGKDVNEVGREAVIMESRKAERFNPKILFNL